MHSYYHRQKEDIWKVTQQDWDGTQKKNDYWEKEHSIME